MKRKRVFFSKDIGVKAICQYQLLKSSVKKLMEQSIRYVSNSDTALIISKSCQQDHQAVGHLDNAHIEHSLELILKPQFLCVQVAPMFSDSNTSSSDPIPTLDRCHNNKIMNVINVMADQCISYIRLISFTFKALVQNFKVQYKKAIYSRLIALP